MRALFASLSVNVLLAIFLVSLGFRNYGLSKSLQVNRAGVRAVGVAGHVNRACKKDLSVRSSKNSDIQIDQATRRGAMQGGIASTFSLLAAPAFAKGPKGFNLHKDTGDRYQFLYPFGWEEIYVKGTDILYKDIIEPLETASVTVIQTEKSSIKDYGDLADVSTSLAEKVLTPAGQTVKIVKAAEKEDNGKTYYQFEFTAQNPRYTRHSLVSAAINNGKYYIFVTGSNEKRWSVMGERLQKVADSFKLV
eukprot:CAMPEP_0184486414 /NCGR_PEP_ID=MMETSP0113_2-20130426/7896_1 /TAXON_ID=91329 /ORGANISM="Norrisiella sphaerica, Strain BC52" /LENGTH=248 /DNA_ID=CAMNT_0026868281 /DNA_START=49 /DNA_END=795 /DNA_ORIENTATION=+